jgi:hypothetical protein
MIYPYLVHPAMRTSNGCRTPSLLLKEEQQIPRELASIAKAVSFVDHGQSTHGVATPLPPSPQLQIDQIVQWYHPHHYLLLSFIGAHFPLPDPITLPKLVQNPISHPLTHETKYDSPSRNSFSIIPTHLLHLFGIQERKTKHSYIYPVFDEPFSWLFLLTNYLTSFHR